MIRYIQGIRLYCPTCHKNVTPVTIITNDVDDLTTNLDFTCECGKVIGKAEVHKLHTAILDSQ